MRMLADSLVAALSLGVAVLIALFRALGEQPVAAPSDLMELHLWSFLQAGVLSTPLVAASLALGGVYRRRRALAGRQQVLAIAGSVSIPYALLFLLALALPGHESLLPARPVLLLAYLLTLAGCLGMRAAKAQVSRRFHLQPKNPSVAWPVEKVLVIGGAGYIGSVLVRRLLDAHYEVRVLDTLLFGDESIRELLPHPRFELVQGDFRDVEAVIRGMRGVDAVIHLGAIVGDPACAVDAQTTLQTNYAATALVTEVCKGSGVSRLVFASTCSVYGSRDHLVDEASPPQPVSLYATTKIDSEGILLAAKTEKFHPTILRLGTAFGWSHRPRFDLVVNLLTAKAIFENRVVIYNEDQWRPFVHVIDIARAFGSVLEAPPNGVSGGIFNVGSAAMNHRLGEVGEILQQTIAGVELVRQSNADLRNYRVSFEKIHRVLGFETAVTLSEGICEIQQQLRAGKIGDYTDARYHNHKYGTQGEAPAVRQAVALGLISHRVAARAGTQAVPVRA